ncbi:AraC family transcriptional regulator ligand-binding domain-containing protein [Paenibacillus sp. OK076]|uniref:AraC family transcriptional regulator ligand-binding domain-containing protein n=1 Tax=Paenibacillus sp. OK076 TaxID=1884379 RepID=UPI00210996BC|nr:AraC family transcriptional regulator ligand-binding domain-containing protein [Paenibacillus sp. OK076]
MNNHNHGVSISMLYPIMKTLVNKGYESEAFFEYVSLDPAMMQNPEARIPVEELERIMQYAARYSDDLYFGLNQGQLLDFADLGLPGYVMMHSKTIGDALAAYQRYNIILYSGFNLDWEVAGTDLILQLSLQHSEKQMSRHCVEDMAVSMVYLISKLANRRVELKEVQSSSPCCFRRSVSLCWHVRNRAAIRGYPYTPANAQRHSGSARIIFGCKNAEGL